MSHLVSLRNMLSCVVIAHFLLGTTNPAQAGAERLPGLNASMQNLTVSGLSSGGFMAVQMHVAHSALVHGAGVLAGGPYYCARGNMARALYNCMKPGLATPMPPVSDLVEYTEKNARKGTIDNDKNLASSHVWLFSGSKDHTVETIVVDQLYDFYSHWIPASSILYERMPGAGHAMIATEASNANECDVSKPPYINQCGDFDATERLFSFLLGKLAPKAKAISGNLIPFDQKEFVDGDMDQAGLDDIGFVYIPTACKKGECKIHVAFHGCNQQTEAIGEIYVRDAGYNGWAEANDVIVLYPQIRSNKFKNPNGCWDWWGYTGKDYALKSGKQIKAVKKMIDRLAEPGQLAE